MYMKISSVEKHDSKTEVEQDLVNQIKNKTWIIMMIIIKV